jgi:hypothetical protein
MLSATVRHYSDAEQTVRSPQRTSVASLYGRRDIIMRRFRRRLEAAPDLPEICDAITPSVTLHRREG